MTGRKRKKPWVGGIGEAEPEGVQIYDQDGRQLAGPPGGLEPEIRRRIDKRRKDKPDQRAA